MQSIFYRVLIFVTLILPAASAFAQTRVISPVAGNGTAGFSGDGGPATSAELNDPAAVATGPAGSLYIADRNNNRVRTINAAGVITTVAGNGDAGWFFESGPALNASLDRPSGVALDKSGNLYIVEFLETGVSRIHRVDAASGIISPVPIPIVLNGAVAIAVDSAGQLYIAEQQGHRIRKVDPASGAITTIAGTGTAGFSGDGGPATAAQLDHPMHLAFDAGGNLYFADSSNNRIRKIAAGSGIITTVAGNGAPGFAGDGGPATDAQLNQPQGVDVDAAGDILIADTLNQRIRRVSGKTGIMTTIVSGDGCAAITSSLQAPGDVTVDASGHFLYIVDEAGNRIWQITLNIDSPPPTVTAISPASGPLGAPVQVTLTGTGFFGSGGASAASAACSLNGTTIFVSGGGVTVSNVSAANDTALSATFNIAANATPGTRDVTVTTDSGTSGAVKFTISVPVIPAPTLTSITPPTNVRGTTATLTLTGTNFVPGATSVSADGTGISITNVSVTGTTSLTATLTVAADANLGVHNVKAATAGGGSNALTFTVQPQGISFVYDMPPMLDPTDNTPIQVALSSASADSVTGTLSLTFNPNASVPADDPNTTFVSAQTSTRTATVTFPANTSTAQLSLPGGLLQAGTVAGTIQLSMSDVQVGGTSVAPADSGFDVQIPRLPPVITGVRIINKTSAGFDVEITGYATSREITNATFDFAAASGQKLLTAELQPDVNSTFITYYQSPSSDPAGGSFVYTQPFVVKQGTVKAVASITVTLANSVGSSNTVTAQ
jgi:sugar lactone lactonase YvrE